MYTYMHIPIYIYTHIHICISLCPFFGAFLERHVACATFNITPYTLSLRLPRCPHALQ